MRALEGLKVLDLTTALNGPQCTMILADNGADVIKIEVPSGEMGRYLEPYDEQRDVSGFFVNINRNKKGVTLNLKNEKALHMFYDLVRDADVVVENYKGGVTKKLKIDYETLKEINPNIIYASSSGFGQYGPLVNRPAYDIVAQAMGGILNLTGYKENEMPVKVGPSVADHLTGIYLTVALLLALHHRDVTGEGQHVEVSMLDSIASILENAIPIYSMTGRSPERNGNIDPTISPFDVYACKDGFVAIGVGSNKMYESLCSVMGKPELAADPRYLTNNLRIKNYVPHLRAEINEWCAKYTKAEIETMMADANVPCGPVLTVKDIFEHPHYKAREMLIDCDYPGYGNITIQGNVVKMSKTPGNIFAPAPLLGQHNGEVFRMTPDQIEQLKAEGVM